MNAAARAPSRPPVWRRLHVRAALLAAPLLMLLGGCMYFLLQHYSAQTALEAGQRMNLGLAQYVVEQQEPGLLNAQGRPDQARVQELAMHVMKINPAVEVYFLDNQGQVLAHALDGLKAADPVGSRIDMQPVREMLQLTTGATSKLPLLGSDPIQPNTLNTFSVAPLRASSGATDGYLYIVLNGRMAQTGAASLSNSQALQAMAMAAAAISALAALVLWLVWRHLTRPLRQLTDELRAFRGDSEPQKGPPTGDEIGVLRGSVQDMQNRIAQQFKALEDGDRQRRELVSNISHDLRTPLSSIRGYVETVMLRGDAIDAEARTNHLRTALRHVDLLGKRIGDLFELSNLDAGRIAPHQEVFCLAELLQDVVQNYQLAAQKRGVAVQLSAGSHGKARVLADIAMIERVLQNLIDNALRYTAQGGSVTLAIENRGAFMEISVSDTGRGIPTEHLPHIFERYWRATNAQKSNDAGTSSGLGLAIVKRILDLHGSAVQVHSEFTRGTRFGFMLPQVG
jgi:signal transduction histidine kinase